MQRCDAYGDECCKAMPSAILLIYLSLYDLIGIKVRLVDNDMLASSKITLST